MLQLYMVAVAYTIYATDTTAHLERHVDVVLSYVVAQVHAGAGLGHAQDALDVAHRDGHAAGQRGGLAQLRVERRDLQVVI
jgi:hypothetical protein